MCLGVTIIRVQQVGLTPPPGVQGQGHQGLVDVHQLGTQPEPGSHGGGKIRVLEVVPAERGTGDTPPGTVSPATQEALTFSGPQLHTG